jgi:hypothetical protein
MKGGGRFVLYLGDTFLFPCFFFQRTAKINLYRNIKGSVNNTSWIKCTMVTCNDDTKNLFSSEFNLYEVGIQC